MGGPTTETYVYLYDVTFTAFDVFTCFLYSEDYFRLDYGSIARCLATLGDEIDEEYALTESCRLIRRRKSSIVSRRVYRRMTSLSCSLFLYKLVKFYRNDEIVCENLWSDVTVDLFRFWRHLTVVSLVAVVHIGVRLTAWRHHDVMWIERASVSVQWRNILLLMSRLFYQLYVYVFIFYEYCTFLHFNGNKASVFNGAGCSGNLFTSSCVWVDRYVIVWAAVLLLSVILTPLLTCWPQQRQLTSAGVELGVTSLSLCQ